MCCWIFELIEHLQCVQPELLDVRRYHNELHFLRGAALPFVHELHLHSMRRGLLSFRHQLLSLQRQLFDVLGNFHQLHFLFRSQCSILDQCDLLCLRKRTLRFGRLLLSLQQQLLHLLDNGDNLHFLQLAGLPLKLELDLRRLRQRLHPSRLSLQSLRSQLPHVFRNGHDLHFLRSEQVLVRTDLRDLWGWKLRFGILLFAMRPDMSDLRYIVHHLHFVPWKPAIDRLRLFAVRQFVFDLQHRKLADGLPLLRHYARTLLLRRQLHLYSLLW